MGMNYSNNGESKNTLAALSVLAVGGTVLLLAVIAGFWLYSIF